MNKYLYADCMCHLLFYVYKHYILLCCVYITELRRRLAAHYRTNCSHLPYLPSMPEHEVAIQELFVTPNIVFKDSKQATNENSGTRVRTFADFLTKDGKQCKNIYLVGEPGSGKSTFMQFFALKWSDLHLPPSAADCDGDFPDQDDFQDKETLRNVDFLFHVYLGDANHHCSYVEIIRDQLLRHIYTRTSELDRACCIVQSVLESPTSCIASDGLDEWVHPTKACACPSKLKGRTPVICRPHSATIVTTSCPWRMAQLPSTDSVIEKRMNIEGTGDVDKLGKQFVNVLNKKAKEEYGKHQALDFSKFKQCVKELGVGHLLYTPILLLRLVCLFFDGKSISNSQFKIYNSIVEMLVRRQSQENIVRSENETILQVFPYKANVRRHLMDIAKLAFDQLFPKQGHSAVVFDSGSCGLNEDSKSFALKCGLLTERKSKSFSSRSYHLSFTHKSFQDFFAVLYLSEHAELFDEVIKPRYQPHGENKYDSCINDLSQIFVFMAGTNGQIATRMSVLMNSQLGTMDFKELSGILLSCHALTRLVTSGLHEADNNGLRELKLCLHYMHFSVSSDDFDMYERLISMNKIHLVLLSVDIDNDYVDKNDDHQVKLNNFIKEVISVHSCTQLRHLSLKRMDNDKDLFDDIPPICVTMTGGLSVQHCSQLQHIILYRVDLGAHELVLPDNITYIELHTVAMTGGLSVKHCRQLQHLELDRVDIGAHKLMLPDNITYIELVRVTMTGGLSVKHCRQLQHLELDRVDIGAHELVLPANITYIELVRVTMTGGLSVKHCTQLQHLELDRVDLGEHELVLPGNITSNKLVRLTMTEGLSVQH